MKRINPVADIQEPAHLAAIEDAFIAAENGTGPRRIIINMPPQHGKSETVSHAIPVWHLDRHPDHLMMLASYQTGYASTFSMKVRDTINDAGNLLSLQIRSDTRGRTEWYTTRGGGMVAQGLEGSFTGRRGDVLIVDDPIKNATVANSAVQRQKIWDWYESTCESRVAPDGIIVIVMTRWHEDDLVGRVLERDGEQAWKILRFPAIAEGDDALGREIGEPLWADRYDKLWFEKLPARANAYLWSGMYQQRPTQPFGSIVKRLWYAGRTNRYDWTQRFNTTHSRYISIDTSESDDPTAAYNVAVVAEWTHVKKLRASGVDRVHLEAADLETWVKRLIETYDFDGKLAGVIIEAKSTGVTLISTLRRTLPRRYRSLIFTYKPRDSKDERLRRAAMWMKLGCYELPFVPSVSGDLAGLDWLGTYEQELFGAPTSQYRDQADATAQIIIYLEAFIEQGYTERNQFVGYREAG